MFDWLSIEFELEDDTFRLCTLDPEDNAIAEEFAGMLLLKVEVSSFRFQKHDEESNSLAVCTNTSITEISVPII